MEVKMVTFNVYGGCVSRDILTPLAQAKEIGVRQFVSFESPVSTVSDVLAECEDVSMEEINNEASRFRKRCCYSNIKKLSLDYLFAKDSDYLLFDIIDSRLPLLKAKDAYFTYGSDLKKSLPVLQKNHEIFNNISFISPFEDIDDAQWNDIFDKLCGKIIEKYPLDRIIINRYFLVKQYRDGDALRDINKKQVGFGIDDPTNLFLTQEGVDKVNKLARRLYDMVEKKLEGCHVIDFPLNVVADAENKWGLNPAHYSKEYYEYGGRAIKIILRGLPRKEEKERLDMLRELYSEKYLSIRKTLEKSKYEWKQECLTKVNNYCRNIILDLLNDNGSFKRFLSDLKAENKKAALLKSNDLIGGILKNAFEKYKIDTVLISPKNSLSSLTTDEIKKCQEADIIISACIHSDNPIEGRGMKAVRIDELLKQYGFYQN